MPFNTLSRSLSVPPTAIQSRFKGIRSRPLSLPSFSPYPQSPGARFQLPSPSISVPDTSPTRIARALEYSDKSALFASCAKITEDSDKYMCRQWEEEIQVLLVYAGLFSAVATGFAVDSFRDLRPDPQGNSLSTRRGSSSLNQVTVQASILYFLSLTLSIIAALVCLLCKQWISEYKRPHPPMLSNLQKLAARQSRYDGLVQWHVPNIIAYIPLILQISSLFLFAGIIIMLLDVSKAMAIIVMVPTIGGLVLILIFTLLPPVLLFLGIWLRITGVKSTWFGQCPFKTPLGWMFTRTVLSMCLYFTPQRSDAHGDIAAMKPHIGSLSWTMCDIPFCSGPRYSDSIVKYIAGIFSSIRSRTLIEFLRQLDWSISLQVVKEVLKSMQTLDPGSDNLNHSDVERGRMAYLNGGAVPLDMLDAFIQGLEQIDDPETKLQKRVVEVCAMLLRRGAPPNNAKIKFCLPICEKIIRAAHDGGELYQDLKRSTIRIQEFLSHSELLDRLTEKLVNRGGGTRGRGTRRRRLGAMNDADMDRNEEGSEAGVEPKVGDTKGAHEARSDGEKAGNIEEWGKDEEVEE